MGAVERSHWTCENLTLMISISKIIPEFNLPVPELCEYDTSLTTNAEIQTTRQPFKMFVFLKVENFSANNKCSKSRLRKPAAIFYPVIF